MFYGGHHIKSNISISEMSKAKSTGSGKYEKRLAACSKLSPVVTAVA